MIIFFDIDNTLMDHSNAEKEACLSIQKKLKHKIKITHTDFVKTWNEVSEKYFRLYLKGLISFQEQRRKRIIEIFGLDEKSITNEFIDEIFGIYLQEYENNWKLFLDVKYCLEYLKDKTLGIISNGDSVQQHKKLIKLDIEKYFKTIIISSEIGYSKPDKKIFDFAYESAHTKPEQQCIYIDDDSNNVEASKKTGMHGLHLDRNIIDNTEKPKIQVIRSLNELLELI